jgi:hypothetical protein
VRMRYADSTQVAKAQHVYTWRRGEISEMVFSASSGPKNYLKNRIFMAFEIAPSVEKISMYVLNGMPFLLLHWGCGLKTTDVTGREVVEVAA